MRERDIAVELEQGCSNPVEVLKEVWSNELVDATALQHRTVGPRVLQQLYGGYGVKPEDYIALPVKSAIWGAEEDTRYSFALILLNHERQKRFRAAREDAPDVDLDIVSAVESADVFTNHYPGFELFLTPDELVTGNLEETKRLRIKGVRGHKYAKHWQGSHSIHDYFYDRYVNYGIGAKESSGRYRRIMTKLNARAQQEENPEEWIRLFLKRRRSLKLPGFIGFREYLLENNGSLHMNDVVPQGIDTSGDIYIAEERSSV